MKALTLQCSLQRCNIDGSKELSIDKCILSNNSPCYYLLTKSDQETSEESAWDKFDDFLDKKKGGR